MAQIHTTRIHRNLHNARRGGPQWVETRGGKVQACLDSVLLTNVTTRIQPAEARKCRESGQRAVCAFFDGVRGGDDRGYVGTGTWLRIAYDPRHNSTFEWVDGDVRRAWNRAQAVRLEADGSAWALEPRWEPQA